MLVISLPKLRAARANRTQADVAVACGKTTHWISNIEQGRRQILAADLLRLLDLYQCRLEDITEDTSSR